MKKLIILFLLSTLLSCAKYLHIPYLVGESHFNIKQIADNKFNIQSKESVEYSDVINVQSLKNEINMLSAKKVNINSKEKSNLF